MNEIKLEVVDSSMFQIAYSVCKYDLRRTQNKKEHIVNIEELIEHLQAYINAEKKFIECISISEVEE